MLRGRLWATLLMVKKLIKEGRSCSDAASGAFFWALLTAGVRVEDRSRGRYRVTEIKAYFYSGGAAKSLTELSHVSVATS